MEGSADEKEMGQVTNARRLSAVVAALVAVALALLAAPVSAQTDTDPTDTSSTTSTTITDDSSTTTTTEPGSTTTTTVDPASTTTVTDPSAEVDPPVTVPPDVSVPPRSYEAPGGDGLPVQSARVVKIDLAGARAKARSIQAQLDASATRRAGLEARLFQLQGEVSRLHLQTQAAIADLLDARDYLADRAADAYVRGNRNDLIVGDPYVDPDGYGQKVVLLDAILDRDQKAIDRFKAARDKVSADEARAAQDYAATQQELEQTKQEEAFSVLALAGTKLELAVTTAGGTIVIHGFVFPVGNPHTLVNDFGDPRLPGTPQAHSHQGNDIVAAEGTPLVAAERGVITSMGSSELGGIQLWLKGESGTSYYYAHLSAYAPDLRLGQVVDAGTFVGLVGHTGDASGPHLHFEIHPGGGGAIDPYPILSAADPNTPPQP